MTDPLHITFLHDRDAIREQLTIEEVGGALILTPHHPMAEFLQDPRKLDDEDLTLGQARRRDILAAVGEWLDSLP